MKPWHPRLAPLPPLTPRDQELRDRLAAVCFHLGLHTFPRFAYPEAYVEILEAYIDRRQCEAAQMMAAQARWQSLRNELEDEEIADNESPEDEEEVETCHV